MIHQWLSINIGISLSTPIPMPMKCLGVIAADGRGARPGGLWRPHSGLVALFSRAKRYLCLRLFAYSVLPPHENLVIIGPALIN